MGLEYGIDICEETLRRLSENTELKDRLWRAFDEITVFEEEDAS
jgi:hypothetical protein